MSQYQAFRRTSVPQQMAQNLETITIPAPTRGLILNESEAFMQPGGALVCDNWKPTMRGEALRGGCEEWCDLYAPTAATWTHSHAYAVNNTAHDPEVGSTWKCLVAHTSPSTGTFEAYRVANPANWELVPIPPLDDPSRLPVISTFNYASGANHQMFAANINNVYNVTASLPLLVKSGQSSGNYVAAQMDNASGSHLLAVNDAGDFPLHYDGVTWTTMNAGQIHADTTVYPGTPVATGQHLTYVCKYRNRLFFIEQDSMNAWYLGIDAFQGQLELIPLSGSATKGGKLLFCTTWSIDAGDGIDDKLVFMTDLGELLIFTGSNPADAANWRQEGRYEMSPPMGMNAHIAVGGELLIATVDGIMPTSGAITKGRIELELAAITRAIKTMWRDEVLAKRSLPWTMCKWDEYGGMFVTTPGGAPGKRRCLVVNQATTAGARFTGWDAMCFVKLDEQMYFGTQDGRIMQADRTGYDDGVPYVASLVGGWEMFSSPSQTITWRQSRAVFSARASEPFIPQISATTDYVITLPLPPPAGIDPGVVDLWDEGTWDTARWDTGVTPLVSARNTGWISIGITGFTHAPVVQITVAQQVKPVVDLISITATYERAGINV